MNDAQASPWCGTHRGAGESQRPSPPLWESHGEQYEARDGSDSGSFFGEDPPRERGRKLSGGW